MAKIDPRSIDRAPILRETSLTILLRQALAIGPRGIFERDEINVTMGCLKGRGRCDKFDKSLDYLVKWCLKVTVLP